MKTLKYFLGVLTALALSVLLGINADAAAEGARQVPHYDIREEGGTWDGTNYYLPNGAMTADVFFCDGEFTYYLMANGEPMKNRLTYHPDAEHIIYFDEYGHEVFDNFANITMSIAGTPVDDMCYFGSYGYMYIDVLTYDKAGVNLLYANPYGVLERNGWFQFSDGNVGYASEDCSLMTSQFSIDQYGRQIYFQGDGTVAKGLITDGVNYYRMDETDGHLIESFENTDGGAQIQTKPEKEEETPEEKTEHSEEKEDNQGTAYSETKYTYKEDGSLWYYYVFEYDANGNRIKVTWHNVDGSIVNYEESEYDEAGNCIKETNYFYSLSGDLVEYHVKEYDTLKKLIKESIYKSDESHVIKEYDTAGKCVKETWYEVDGSYVIHEYDAKGNCIKYAYYEADGSIVRYSVSDYDKDGNRIKEINYGADGSIESYWKFEYDGKLQIGTLYDADGNIIGGSGIKY